MSTFFNLGSIVLGIISWIPPAIAMHKYKSNGEKHRTFCILSFSFCLASMYLQFFEINHLVQIQDWATLMDITATLRWIAVVLAVITILLNTVVYVLYKENSTGR